MFPTSSTHEFDASYFCGNSGYQPMSWDFAAPIFDEAMYSLLGRDWISFMESPDVTSISDTVSTSDGFPPLDASWGPDEVVDRPLIECDDLSGGSGDLARMAFKSHVLSYRNAPITMCSPETTNPSRSVRRYTPYPSPKVASARMRVTPSALPVPGQIRSLGPWETNDEAYNAFGHIPSQQTPSVVQSSCGVSSTVGVSIQSHSLLKTKSQVDELDIDRIILAKKGKGIESSQLADSFCRVRGCRKYFRLSKDCRRHRDVHFPYRYKCPNPYCRHKNRKGKVLGMFPRADSLIRHFKKNTCSAYKVPLLVARTVCCVTPTPYWAQGDFELDRYDPVIHIVPSDKE